MINKTFIATAILMSGITSLAFAGSATVIKYPAETFVTESGAVIKIVKPSDFSDLKLKLLQASVLEIDNDVVSEIEVTGLKTATGRNQAGASVTIVEILH